MYELSYSERLKCSLEDLIKLSVESISILEGILSILTHKENLNHEELIKLVKYIESLEEKPSMFRNRAKNLVSLHFDMFPQIKRVHEGMNTLMKGKLDHFFIIKENTHE